MAPTPLDWLNTLYPQLTARAQALRTYDAFYSGDHPLPFVSPAHIDKMRSGFRQMLEESKSNFMRLLVDVVEERLQVDGFRLSAHSNLKADKDSWDIWQANGMDSLSRTAFIDALVLGVSYLSVWPDNNGDGHADIAVESPLEVIIAYTPGSNFRQRDAALKAWQDTAAGLEYATLYLPDRVCKFQRPLQDADPGTKASARIASANPTWVARDGGDAELANPLGIVPIVALRNRGRTLCEGESELADVTSVQNQINGFLFLLALAGYFGAHKQRWATGITLMEDEATGQIKEPFDAAIDKLWADENPDVKFGEFSQTDLTQYLKAIDQKVTHLAITTRTPKHYLLPEGQEPSGDAIKSAESGLVRKVERKQAAFGEALEEVIRLARKAEGAKDMPVDSEVVWADASTESEAVLVDATIKKFVAGLIPAEQALEDLGYSQVQIARMMSQKASALLLSALANPAAPGQPPDTHGEGAVPGAAAVQPQEAVIKPVTLKA